MATSGLLAACGGGSGTATGSQPAYSEDPPQETVAEISVRLAGLDSRSDSRFLSALYVEDIDKRPFIPVCEGEVSLSESMCYFYLRSDTDRLPLHRGLQGVPFTDSGLETRTAFSRHGITIVAQEHDNEAGDVDFLRYGAVMNHSAFAAQGAGELVYLEVFGQYLPFRLDDISPPFGWRRRSYAFGDLTGSSPDGSATWTGLMVGAPISDRAEDRSSFLQGDASLTYDFADTSLDASFTGIRNIVTKADHSVRRLRFDDIPVSDDGRFHGYELKPGIRKEIAGGFYGPGHAETAGILEYVEAGEGIVGSFGARR